jgi:hypothetical protein
MLNKISRLYLERYLYQPKLVSKHNNISIELNLMHIYLLIPLLILLLSGCNIKQSTQIYENSESGISLEKPSNWEVTYTERNGMISLSPKMGLWDKQSSRIEIFGPACRTTSNPWTNNPDELKSDVNRIRILYGLNAVTYSQEPKEYIIGGNEVVMAAVDIPTLSMVDDPNRILVDDKGQNIFQTIEIYAISNDNNGVMGYIYKGNDDELNKQAREIIDSIQLNCPVNP